MWSRFENKFVAFLVDIAQALHPEEVWEFHEKYENPTIGLLKKKFFRNNNARIGSAGKIAKQASFFGACFENSL